MSPLKRQVSQFKTQKSSLETRFSSPERVKRSKSARKLLSSQVKAPAKQLDQRVRWQKRYSSDLMLYFQGQTGKQRPILLFFFFHFQSKYQINFLAEIAMKKKKATKANFVMKITYFRRSGTEWKRRHITDLSLLGRWLVWHWVCRRASNRNSCMTAAWRTITEMWLLIGQVNLERIAGRQFLSLHTHNIPVCTCASHLRKVCRGWD